MKIISFNLRGKMAHFRKFYSNSSALSYFIPPRTTIVGIMAGLLGEERDTYYDAFSMDQCQITVTSRKPIKKNMQKLNYLMIKKENDLNGSQEHHSQTATELVIPQNIQRDYIDYQIWFHHKNHEIMERLEAVLKDSDLPYKSLGIAVGMGTAFNLGWIEFEGIYDGEERTGAEGVSISSVIPLAKLKEIRIDLMQQEHRLIKEELPLEFDSERRITTKGLGNMMMNLYGNAVPADVESFIKLDNGECIIWME